VLHHRDQQTHVGFSIAAAGYAPSGRKPQYGYMNGHPREES
jgi:hypothetical protein